MRRIASCIASLALATPALAGTLDAPIIGGTPATPGQFPAVVVIQIGQSLCTGTLIAPDWVLTAAHCVSAASLDLPSQAEVTAAVTVHVGTVDLGASAGVSVGASDTIPAPAFDTSTSGVHDVGLIQLATPVTDIVPAAVNLSADRTPVGIDVATVGFGVTTTGGDGHAGVENVVTQTSISCASQGRDDATLLCFSQTDGTGICNGDSGAPMFATIDDQLMEVAVVAAADASCTEFSIAARTEAEQAFLVAHVPALGSTGSAGGSSGAGTDEGGGGCDAGGSGGPGTLIALGAVALALGARSRRSSVRAPSQAPRPTSPPER